MNFAVRFHVLQQPQVAEFRIDRNSQPGPQPIAVAEASTNSGIPAVQRVDQSTDRLTIHIDNRIAIGKTSQRRWQKNPGHSEVTLCREADVLHLPLPGGNVP